MWGRNLFFLPLLLVGPSLALAACTPRGATVVYVNGITTSYTQAKSDLARLEEVFRENGGDAAVVFKNGYNPTHLDGLGDKVESVSQAFNAPISDYDLDTILAQIASEVNSRNILLVGHSQGAFYTNEIYDYLVRNGELPASIAIYDLATPANHVEGSGTYLTSTDDRAINYIRQLDMKWGVPPALPANITIPQESGYADSVWGGHSPRVYLDGAGKRIASDIRAALAKLSTVGDVPGSCFSPPALSTTYAVQRAFFAVADPGIGDLEYAAIDAGNTVASVLHNANEILHTAFSDAVFSVIPRPTKQSAAGIFGVEKALYGSSLSVADYKALSNGEDIPQVEPAAENPSSQIPADPEAQEKPAPSQPQQLQPEQKISEIASSTPPIVPVIPMSALVPLLNSPGFGGGSAAPVAAIEASAIPANVPDDASSTPTQETDIATTTDQTSTTSTTTEPAQGADQTTASTTLPNDPATSTLSVDGATTTEPTRSFGSSPVTDHFDTDDLSSWTGLSDGAFKFDPNSADCYANGCIVNNVFNDLAGMYKLGTPLSSGTAVLYFRNYGYQAQISFDICNNAGCASNNWAGIYITPKPIFSTAWHYWFLAWREGESHEETCGLTDESTLADCTWSDSGLPNGTYDGIVIAQNGGMYFGGSIYFDELGGKPYTSQ